MNFKDKQAIWINRDILVVARRLVEEKQGVTFEDVQRDREGAFHNEDWVNFRRLDDLEKKMSFEEDTLEIRAEATSIVKGISYEEAIASMVKGYDD